MKRFNYRAKEMNSGKVVKGKIQAESERAAGSLLVEKGYVPEKITEEGKSFLDQLNNRVTKADQITFTRQFSTLIGAGVPLANSLRTVAQQTTSKPMKQVIEEVLASVEAGKSLTEAFSQHPKVFGNVYIALVQAGETSGMLDEALKQLADQEEKDAAMISKIRGAMVYPAIILVVIIAVLVFMIVTVVPEVEKLYADMGEELPVLTQIMVGISDFFESFWWVIAIVVVVLVVLFVNWRKTPGGRKTLDVIKLNTPVFKGLFRRLYMSRFARTAQMLLATGVSMLDSMTIAAKAMNNTVVEEQIMKAANQVKSGKALSAALEGRDYILPLVPQMASIGEQSGKIDEMLGRAATVYENELNEKIENISTMIEPIMMVIMAGLIGVVIGACLLPIYSLVSSIG